MKVGVVVPVYNGADYIANALDSVLAQSYQDFEVVVVDDGSSDGTVRIVSGYDDSRITLVRHDENLGVSASRNSGVRNVGGDLLAFLDHDDVWHPEKLQRHVDRHQSSTAALVYSDVRKIDATGEVVALSPRPDPNPPGEPLVKQLLLDDRVMILTLSSITLSRSAWEKVGGSDPSLRISVDIDLYVRLAGEYCFERIEGPLVDKRAHEANLSDDYRGRYEAHERIFQMAQRRYSYLDSADARRHRARIAYRRATSELLAGQSAEAAKYARESLRNERRLRSVLVLSLATADTLAGPYAPGYRVLTSYDRRFG